MRSYKPILLLEDDYVDAMTVRRALKDLNVLNSLVRVVNGEEAIDYLNDETNVKPCVILLDLNMPKMNGNEFLKVIKSDPQLRCIPVVVLTTSKADQDKMECFSRSIAGYIVKPTDYNDFVRAMKILDLYWTLSELPNSSPDNVDFNLEKAVSS
jgi:CheY-like chemotaxis protein